MKSYLEQYNFPLFLEVENSDVHENSGIIINTYISDFK